MNALVYSSSLMAAFLGGILALFAPCCVVSLLPTFTGTAIQRGRRRLPATSLLFAAGVATILLPIVLGIGALGQVFAAHRRVVFLVVGIFLAFLGLNILSGRHWILPMPTLRMRTSGAGIGSVFALGLLSGVASSCCAPVVVGVVAMSALANSVVGALGLGLAYVFGMVFPLFLAALFWDRLPGRQFRLPVSPVRIRGRAIPWSDLVAATMFLAIAAAALLLSATGQMSYSPDWLTAWNRRATSLAADLAASLGHLPLFVQALGLIVIASAVVSALIASRRPPSAEREALNARDSGQVRGWP
ncbi:MAG: cytochrome c biogenesis CcdA family protein [Candidatus Dormibacteraeota bacterium]|nr:cytochrome c biogenesis CcdA family protein [Candidatus Dormibacteraeota bacterium]